MKEVSKKKSEGGLGIRPLKEVNEVACLKLIWRILSGQKSLWVKWIQIYLIRKGSLWTIRDNTAAGSWMWKKILKTRAVAKGFHRVDIKNGEDTSSWNDHWCEMGRLIEVLGIGGRIDLGIPANATVAEAIASHRRRYHRSNILNEVEEEMERVKTDNSQMEDIPLWRSKEGIYRRSFSSRNTWLEIRNNYATQEWSKGVWFKHATPKYAFHVWTAMRDRLSTCDRMLKWNQNINPICVLCQRCVETRNHLFFSCSYSSKIWQKLVKGLLHLRYTEEWEAIVSLLLDSREERVRLFLLRYTFQTATHTIWWERNRRRHGEEQYPYSLLIKTIDKTVRNRLSTIRRQGDHKMEEGLQMWFATR